MWAFSQENGAYLEDTLSKLKIKSENLSPSFENAKKEQKMEVHNKKTPEV